MRAADLSKHSSSGISYARAAKKFGTTPEVVREYARQVKEYNRQQRAAAKAWGYKEEYRTAPSLADLARDKAAHTRFGGAPELFTYMARDVKARLADGVADTWASKASDYVSNLKLALTNSPESAFSESRVSQALKKLDTMTDRQVMKATGGEFFSYWYGDEENQTEERSDILTRILAARPRKS